MPAYWMTNRQARQQLGAGKKLKPVQSDILRTAHSDIQLTDMAGALVTVPKGTTYKCVGLRDGNGYAATFDNLGTMLFEASEGIKLV